MFILRIIHKESNTASNWVVGNSYTVDKNVFLYYPNLKEDTTISAVLVGDNENVYQLSNKGYDYYIMTDTGKTFEKLRP